MDSIRTKLTEEKYFEVRPYGDSGNGTAAAAARRLTGYYYCTGAAAACSDRSVGHSELGAFGTGGVRNWGRNRDVKTNRLVIIMVALWNRAYHYIFMLWFLSFFLAESQPSQSGCLPYLHIWCASVRI